MIVVLNGDGSPGVRTDERRFAKTASDTIPESAVVALLRPGYADGEGHVSPGERGADIGDNYTSEQLEAVATAVSAYRHRYPKANVVLVGDSGGAAIAANLAGIRPDLVDGIVLVGCPCTLPEWRAYMEQRKPAIAWEQPVASLDPLKTAGGIAPGLRAAVIVGAEDEVTPVRFSRSYAEALTLRGIATDYRILPGRGHDLLNDPEVIAATSRLAASLPEEL
ncbi:alpha/beta hydrolase [Sphingosinithalassobacter tenebrarum]|uniref:Alpha/beta hydrolase n=1 Tax=Stakelama tenebrarum TaxID=2711215 RepID=A0A6G6YA55_9SPHN|nr:alpha/beta hydrolase [Sphingosinithalassobacter tenebrarum]